MRVQRHVYQPGAAGGKRCACTRVAWVFHPHRIPFVQQGGRQQLQCLLRAGQHQHLARVAAYPARLGEVSRDRLAQRWQALGVAIKHQRRRVPPQTPLQQLAPQIGRKRLQVRTARHKGARVVGFAAATGAHHPQAPCGQQRHARRFWVDGRGPRLGPCRGGAHVDRHKTALPHLPAQIALGFQLGVGRLHCHA